MDDFKRSLIRANRVLHELGHLNGIDIELDEAGVGYVEVENKYPVTLQLTNSGNFLKLTGYVGEHRSNANPKTLEYLLACNYEADFLKGCTVGLCTLSRRYTLSFMHPLFDADARLLNNCVLNLGMVIKALDQELEQRTQEEERAKHNHAKTTPAGLTNFVAKRL
jgi:hypothetical protein